MGPNLPVHFSGLVPCLQDDQILMPRNFWSYVKIPSMDVLNKWPVYMYSNTRSLQLGNRIPREGPKLVIG
jgi:hypothetical protein